MGDVGLFRGDVGLQLRGLLRMGSGRTGAALAKTTCKNNLLERVESEMLWMVISLVEKV